MPQTGKLIREFNFLHLNGAMGKPQNEFERCLIDDIKRFESGDKTEFVGMYRKVCLIIDKNNLKKNVEKKQEFWKAVLGALKRKQCHRSQIIEKAAENSGIGLELYKRISSYMEDFVVHFPTPEIAQFYSDFFYRLVDSSVSSTPIEQEMAYNTINVYMIKMRLTKLFRTLPLEDQLCVNELMEGQKNVSPGSARRVRSYVKEHLKDIYDCLSR